MAVTILNPDGTQTQVELNNFGASGLGLYREAMDRKLSLRQLINQKFPTVAGGPDAFQQMCISAGLRFKADEQTGIPAANLRDILDPYTVDASTGNYVNLPHTPDSRILFPAALMEAVEDKLQSKEDVATGVFESMIAYRQTVASARVEQPVISYSGANGPEDSQFQAIGQNSRPPIMLSITASDIARRIPTTSIGMEISQEALAANSLDLVALTLARFYKIANYNEWISQMLMVLNGDADAASTTLSAGTSALATFTADSLDATGITTNGQLTQLAWLKYLYKNSMSMTKTHIVTDFDGAMSIENRTNRPTNVQNNSVDRLDVPFSIAYPSFQQTIQLVVMPENSGWTANTLMGLDKSQALAKITSSSAEYSAIEQIVMKKSTELRIDRGFIVYRLFDTAFNVMTLTV